MTKRFIINDIRGIQYEIKNIKAFYQHLVDFHPIGASIHEEEGHYFSVDDTFREKIKKMFEKSK